MRLLVIIPAYNEAPRIRMVVSEVRFHVPWADILVINDGSEDRTAGEAHIAGVEVTSHTTNLGYGAALATGYIYAIKNNYPYLVQLDGDGQHDPSYILPMIEFLNWADLVIGSRFLGEPGYSIPFCRKLGMRLFSYMASRKCGFRLTDTTSGFRAMNRRAIEFSLGPSYDASALVKMVRAGLVIKEIPVRMRAGQRGKSMHHGAGVLGYVFRMSKALGGAK